MLTTDLKWNVQRIEELIPELATTIRCLQPSQTGVEDAFIWQPLTSGIYTSKSGYHSTMTSSYHHSTNAPIDWYKDTWRVKCSPKLQAFLWSIVQKAVPLGANLQRRGITPAVNCPRCRDQETTTHIFFSCPFAQEIWSLLPLTNVAHLATAPSFETVMLEFRSKPCLPPSGITTNILPWGCWQIWISRNQLIFE